MHSVWGKKKILDSLPRPLSSMRGNQDVRTPQWIVSPVRDIIKDTLDHGTRVSLFGRK